MPSVKSGSLFKVLSYIFVACKNHTAKYIDQSCTVFIFYVSKDRPPTDVCSEVENFL